VRGECLVVLQLQDSQEFTDFVAVLGRVAQGDVGVDAVTVATTDPFALHVPESIRSATMRWAARSVIPTESRVRVAVQAEKDLGVVREEPPRLGTVVTP
jgi:hypothetical protein